SSTPGTPSSWSSTTWTPSPPRTGSSTWAPVGATPADASSPPAPRPRWPRRRAASPPATWPVGSGCPELAYLLPRGDGGAYRSPVHIAEQELDAAVAEDDFTGVVTVDVGDLRAVERAEGFRHRALGAPMTPDKIGRASCRERADVSVVE